MTDPTWRERKQELLRLLAELSLEVYAPATTRDEKLHRALLQPDQAGSRPPTANGPTKRLRTVALSLDDFPPLSTLSSTSSLCRVELVRPASALTGVDTGGKSSTYVMKTVDKRWAFRMRAQQSHIHELAVLRLGLRDEETNQKRRIPRLVASFLSPSSFHIVLSHVPGGDLSMILERHAGTGTSSQVSASGLQEAWVREWMAELVDALEWLHSSGWAHRDIKPQNLLLDTDGHLLLTDFGSAAPLLPASSSSSSSSSPSSPFAIARKHCRALIGTPDYIAPEILAHAEALYLEEEEEEDSDDEGGGGLGIKSASGAAVAAAAAAESKDELAAYGAEVDLWSSGIVMYELLFGAAPFYAVEIPETYDRIVRWQDNLRFPPASSVSKAAESLIRALLTNAESRPTFQKIKYHEFFNNVKWNQLRTGQPTFQPPSPDSDLPASPSFSRSQRSFAQSFDVDSFMSSPGLSILRPSPTTLVRFRDTEQLYWQASEFGGLTTLPAEHEFERVPSAAAATSSTGELPEMASPPSGPRRKATSSFETPARPRWSAQIEREVQATTTSRSSSSSRRTSDGLEAWREMQEHAWSVSRSARKRSATSSGGTPCLPPPSSGRSGRSEEQDRLGGLQSRHKEVLKQLDDMDDKYSSLFALAAGQKSSPVR
ncbi:kinase-like protein [Rhodotorula sp. JG-1b]|nr:kinase-like protein [Rhodotorula sp. JG-1b]